MGNLIDEQVLGLVSVGERQTCFAQAGMHKIDGHGLMAKSVLRWYNMTDETAMTAPTLSSKVCRSGLWAALPNCTRGCDDSR